MNVRCANLCVGNNQIYSIVICILGIFSFSLYQLMMMQLSTGAQYLSACSLPQSYTLTDAYEYFHTPTHMHARAHTYTHTLRS